MDMISVMPSIGFEAILGQKLVYSNSLHKPKTGNSKEVGVRPWYYCLENSYNVIKLVKQGFHKDYANSQPSN